MKHNHKGFVFIELVIAFVVLSVLVFVGFKVYNNSSKITETAQTDQTTTVADKSETTTQQEIATTVTWRFIGGTWQSSGTPPQCPSPLLATPVNLAIVESILYPGQYRGDDYKVHGGFRFLDSQGPVDVTAPMDATVINGAKYTSVVSGVGNEVQYMFEFHNSCGIAYRFDHLDALSAKLQALADTLPDRDPGDSRTTNFDRKTTVAKGELLATTVGFRSSNNVFVDWGVYDLRNTNQASKNTSYSTTHESIKALSFYGVCWLDLLSPADTTTVRAFPGSGNEGAKSNYC